MNYYMNTNSIPIYQTYILHYNGLKKKMSENETPQLIKQFLKLFSYVFFLNDGNTSDVSQCAHTALLRSWDSRIAGSTSA